jgi:hypothetical protein
VSASRKVAALVWAASNRLIAGAFTRLGHFVRRGFTECVCVF